MLGDEVGGQRGGDINDLRSYHRDGHARTARQFAARALGRRPSGVAAANRALRIGRFRSLSPYPMRAGWSRNQWRGRGFWDRVNHGNYG